MNTINLPSNKEVLKNKEEKLNEIKKILKNFMTTYYQFLKMNI